MNPTSPPARVTIGLTLVAVVVAAYAFSAILRKSHLTLYDQLLKLQVVGSS